MQSKILTNAPVRWDPYGSNALQSQLATMLFDYNENGSWKNGIQLRKFYTRAIRKQSE